ncbi:hypothetical protein ELI_0835 [Eubacterium callanderi]|uniref:Uncharacterized protein n=1 Tax=Eubacterium callanderi TaxID=53442 RepID=E3GKA2_9FIRM|nr:hypothetical protein ELI_0835 [Eubacterium callanderi]
MRIFVLKLYHDTRQLKTKKFKIAQVSDVILYYYKIKRL